MRWGALDYACLDQSLKGSLHDINRICKALSREDQSLSKYLLWNVVGVTLQRRKAKKIDAYDRSANRDLGNAIGVKFIVHGPDP